MVPVVVAGREMEPYQGVVFVGSSKDTERRESAEWKGQSGEREKDREKEMRWEVMKIRIKKRNEGQRERETKRGNGRYK